MRFPLRGRKSRDFAIWSAALQWWVVGDPTMTIPRRDWAPMAYLKDRLDDHDGLIHDWPDYLAGFFTAEGYLGIDRTTRTRLRPRAAIRVRQDDRYLLDELCRRADTGRIYAGERRAGPPVAQWIVCGRDDLMKLVAIFDRHPPRGRKLREYDIWREAVFLHANPPRRHDDRLNSLRTKLQRARVYRQPIQPSDGADSCRSIPDS
jgi:hypothetical protein